jgi:hypothetical protein
MHWLKSTSSECTGTRHWNALVLVIAMHRLRLGQLLQVWRICRKLPNLECTGTRHWYAQVKIWSTFASLENLLKVAKLGMHRYEALECTG